MIRKIRKTVQGPAAKVIVFIICIPFALFGAEIFLVSALQQDSVGEVNGESLARYEYARLLEEAVLRLQRTTPELDIETEQLARELALRALIRDELLAQFASSSRIEYPKSEIDSTLRSLPEFQEDGSYRAYLFDGYARQLGITRDALRESLSRSLLLNIVNAALLTASPAAGKDLLFRLWLQLRDIEYLEFPREDFAPASLSEAEQRTFYKTNQQRFMTTEEADILLIHLPEKEIERRAEEKITPESIEEAYLDYVQTLEQQVKKRAAHIMLTWDGFSGREAALARASQLREQIVQGADFAELARRESEDFSAEQGGDLGFSSGDVFPEAFEQALSSMQVGDVSQPLVIDDAVHIVKLTEIRKPETASRKEAEADLIEELTQRAREELRTQLREQLSELAYASATMDEIAAETGLNLAEVEQISRGAAEQVGPTADAAVLNAVFSEELRSGELISEPINLQDGSTALVQVKAYRPARQQSFEEAQDAAKALLTDQLAAQAQLQAVTAAESALSEGRALAATAKSLKLKTAPRTLTNIDRTTPLLEPQVVHRAFALPVDSGSVWERVSLPDGSVVLVRLLAARLPELSAAQKQQETFFGLQLEGLYSNSSYSRFSHLLRQKAEISIRPTDEYEFGSGSDPEI